MSRRQITVALLVYACGAFMTLRFVQRMGEWGDFGLPGETADISTPRMGITRNVIRMAQHAEPLMPRGSTVTVITKGSIDPGQDAGPFLSAVGFLPHHHVQQPMLDLGQDWPDFVISVEGPFEHQGYELLRHFEEGWLYKQR